MKCELCHEAAAETAITRGEGEEAEELYVCSECAKAERLRRQKNRQRTRKVQGLPPGVELSVTEISGGDGETPPPFIGAIMNALQGIVSNLDAAADPPKAPREEKLLTLPPAGVEGAFCVGNRLHLEGLHLIGELEPARRAMHALKMDLLGVEADGVRDAGHAYSFAYSGPVEKARRVLEDLVREERNARIRLLEEMPRVFGDALCRSLAILKNCRLLAPGEFFDLLSSIRLGAREKLLDGISFARVDQMMQKVDLSSGEDKMEQAERDKIDAERADEMNRLFGDVVLNDRAEERFL